MNSNFYRIEKKDNKEQCQKGKKKNVVCFSLKIFISIYSFIVYWACKWIIFMVDFYENEMFKR